MYLVSNANFLVLHAVKYVIQKLSKLERLLEEKVSEVWKDKSSVQYFPVFRLTTEIYRK